MTMSRNEKTKMEHRTKGLKPMVSGRTGQPITLKQYADGYLGRGTTDAVTATAKKMDRMGYRPTDRGGFKKITRALFG